MLKRAGDTQASRERRGGVFFSAQTPLAVMNGEVPASEPLGMDGSAVRLNGAEEEAAAMALEAKVAWEGLDERHEMVDVADGLEAFAPLDDLEALSSSGARAVSTAVTLIVYGWKMVEPGTLWWVFPSVAAALGAAHAMTNAVKWAIVKGPPRGAIVDIAMARAAGSVLVEQTA
jgi:hypothetical protein